MVEIEERRVTKQPLGEKETWVKTGEMYCSVAMTNVSTSRRYKATDTVNTHQIVCQEMGQNWRLGRTRLKWVASDTGRTTYLLLNTSILLPGDGGRRWWQVSATDITANVDPPMPTPN